MNNGTVFMFRKSKEGSVIIQGWFVFLVFCVLVNRAQLNRFYYLQAQQELKRAQEIIEEHNKIIEMMRQKTYRCELSDETCFTQSYSSSRFLYQIKFDQQTRHVIEILITKH
jgi:hypothetical protein